MKRVAAAWFFMLILQHGPVGAQSAQEGRPQDYCSRVKENLIIFGATDPVNCGLGTGRILGLNDRLIVDGVFGLEIGLGVKDKEITAEPHDAANKASSFLLRFNRHNVFFGLRFKW